MTLSNTRANRFTIWLIICTLAFLRLHNLCAQPPLPNRSVTARTIQALNFSTIYTGNSGGTVVIAADGSRTSTGSVILVNTGNQPTPAIFEISLCQGRTVTLTYPAMVTLNGSNGGTLSLQITPEKGAGGTPFQVNNDCNFITPLRVGGTLTVPASAPVGLYTGSFEIIFNQQ